MERGKRGDGRRRGRGEHTRGRKEGGNLKKEEGEERRKMNTEMEKRGREGNFMAQADATTFCSQKVCRLSLGSEEEGTFGITEAPPEIEKKWKPVSFSRSSIQVSKSSLDRIIGRLLGV